jgi:hypothetical protein
MNVTLAQNDGIAQLAIIVIIAVTWGVIKLIGKALESVSSQNSVGEQQGDEGGEKSVYQASQREIKEFLSKAGGQKSSANASSGGSSRRAVSSRGGSSGGGQRRMSRSRSSESGSGGGEREWIIRKDGKRYGPASTEKVQKWIRNGQVGARTKVMNMATGEWRRLSRVRVFASVLKEHLQKKARARKEKAGEETTTSAKTGRSRTGTAPPARRFSRNLGLPTQLSKQSLKQAVIWSEILGTPVSMRRSIGHRPPTME